MSISENSVNVNAIIELVINENRDLSMMVNALRNRVNALCEQINVLKSSSDSGDSGDSGYSGSRIGFNACISA